MESNQTAAEWFYDKIKSHFEHDGDLLETLTFTLAIAKKKEREQHEKTWEAATLACEDRMVNIYRHCPSFDQYKIQ